MKTTDVKLRNQTIYSIFVRNHTAEGTFAAIEPDLDRIRGLGTDIIWLMPIHPIGEVNRKGEQGSPYAIRDYRKINPAYGTMEDFEHLVSAVHDRGMKCIIDVVYNHTSPDSWLAVHHPEYFYRKPDGGMGNKVGDWTDVVDLDYNKKDLWDYQIETLKQWAEVVDGFRCDVAPLVPVDFWIRARTEVEKVRPGCIWLAETVYPGFITELRNRGFGAASDGEIYRAFDITYDYDIEDVKTAYREGAAPLKTFIGALERQESIYPADYVKLRFTENHDQDRAAHKIPNESDLLNWTAFTYFQKGAMLLYAGQEAENNHWPSLFDTDPVEWNTGKDLSELLRKLAAIKKREIMSGGSYTIAAVDGTNTAILCYRRQGRFLAGIFSLDSGESTVKLDSGVWPEAMAELGAQGRTGIPDGDYENLLTQEVVTVKKGCLRTHGTPIIIEGSL